MTERLIETTAALKQLVAELSTSAWLALDTEFIRERTYYAQLCLIQISNGTLHACIDPLAVDDLAPLQTLLDDERIVKVLHAAHQDLEIFLHDWGRVPQPVFDTQSAAALLGLGDQLGYANLVKRVLDIELAKDQSRTDWSQRPLADEQLRYALDDVIYLGQLYEHIRDGLDARDRLPWLEAEFAALADPGTYVQESASAWQRVKNRQRLRGRELAVLQALAAWREEQAIAQDRPRKWVVKDEVLIDLARRRPADLARLERVRGLDAGQLRRHGETLLALIAQAAARPESEWPREPKRPQPLPVAREAQIDLLAAALRLIAAEHQLSPQAVATRRDIEQLVRGDATSPLLSGWRRQVAGDDLTRVLQGDMQLVSTSAGAALQTSTETEPA